MSDVQRHDFTVSQGAAWAEDLFYYLDDRETPVNLTNYSCTIVAKTEPGGDVLATLSTAAGTIIIDGPLGKISINVPTATTAAWDWTEPAIYRLDLVDTQGEHFATLEGRIHLAEF